jgi:hypothetical protein
MSTQPIIDRTAARAIIRARVDAEAREAGYADHIAELDADYEAWQARTHKSQ